MLLKRGASVEVELKGGAKSVLAAASRNRHKVVAGLLLDRFAPLGVKTDNYGDSALTVAREGIDAEAADLLYELGALEEYLVEGTQRSDGYAIMEEEDLGRLAAYISADHDGIQSKDLGTPVLKLIELARAAERRATQLRSTDPRDADEHQTLFDRLQLAAAALLEEAKDDNRGGDTLRELLESEVGQKALNLAVTVRAKTLFTQPVVQRYLEEKWRSEIFDSFAEEAGKGKQFQWYLEKKWRSKLFDMIVERGKTSPWLGYFAMLVLLALLLVLEIVSLVPIVALYPPLEATVMRLLGRNVNLYRAFRTLAFSLSRSPRLSPSLAFSDLARPSLTFSQVIHECLVEAGEPSCGRLLRAVEAMRDGDGDVTIVARPSHA